jgi:hypothetical protein
VVEVTYPTRPEHLGDGAVDHMMRMKLPPPAMMQYAGVIFRPQLIEWFLDTYGELCMFDRTPYDRDPNIGRIAAKEGVEMGQSHDWPILKRPYDPGMVTL